MLVVGLAASGVSHHSWLHVWNIPCRDPLTSPARLCTVTLCHHCHIFNCLQDYPERLASAERSLAKMQQQLVTSQERIGVLQGQVVISDQERALSQQRLASAEGSLLKAQDCLKETLQW